MATSLAGCYHSAILAGGKLFMRIAQISIFTMMIVSLHFPAAWAEIRNADGNIVSTWCSTNANRERIGDVGMQAGSCLGYLWSIIDIQSSGNAVNGKKACIPRNADMNQIVDLFRSYVRDHPERRHLLAANLAAEAFALAFPCRP
jgi:Rap1a immunity proteins